MLNQQNSGKMKRKMRVLGMIGMMMMTPAFINNLAAQPPPPPPVEIPIDGGLFFLLVAGMAYGAKKLIENKSNLK